MSDSELAPEVERKLAAAVHWLRERDAGLAGRLEGLRFRASSTVTFLDPRPDGEFLVNPDAARALPVPAIAGILVFALFSRLAEAGESDPVGEDIEELRDRVARLVSLAAREATGD
ncbi:MAG: hypothetical protein ACE5HQ_13095 [Gemmatimonadota bacterium]